MVPGKHPRHRWGGAQPPAYVPGGHDRQSPSYKQLVGEETRTTSAFLRVSREPRCVKDICSLPPRFRRGSALDFAEVHRETEDESWDFGVFGCWRFKSILSRTARRSWEREVRVEGARPLKNSNPPDF